MFSPPDEVSERPLSETLWAYLNTPPRRRTKERGGKGASPRRHRLDAGRAQKLHRRGGGRGLASAPNALCSPGGLTIFIHISPKGLWHGAVSVKDFPRGGRGAELHARGAET